jgi:phosphocarrier protein HPr
MPSCHLTIINKLGLHARAATKFANCAKKYGCKLNVEVRGQSIDGKSIMSLMLLAAAKGSDITLHAEGNDADECLEALASLINNKFDEDE